jgi:hypothetical protein
MSNLKTSFTAITALIAGICTSAYSSTATVNHNTPNAFFEFDGIHYTPTFFNVQDESKWIRVSDIGACDNKHVKACRIEVGSEYFRCNILLPTATIIAQESSPGTAFVTGGNIVNIRNKK